MNALSHFFEIASLSKAKVYVVTAIVAASALGLGGWHYLDTSEHSASGTAKTSTPADKAQPSNASGKKEHSSSSTPLSTPKSTASPPSTHASTPKPPTAQKAAPTASPSQTSTSGSSPGSTPPPPYSCILQPSDTNGQCNFSAVSYITGANSNPWVGQNIWNGGGGYQQTLYANSPKDWYITANANTNYGGVLTYPNTGFWMTNAVDSYSSVTSSWDVTIPTTGHTAGWAAYDLWFNNWADEVMIQTDLTVPSQGYYDCTAVTTATFNGMPWHLCVFGSERVWKPGTDDNNLINRTSGSIDIKTILTWMEQNNYLPANSTWTAGSFGFEVCDTGGVTETFRVNDFSWSAQ